MWIAIADANALSEVPEYRLPFEPPFDAAPLGRGAMAVHMGADQRQRRSECNAWEEANAGRPTLGWAR